MRAIKFSHSNKFSLSTENCDDKQEVWAYLKLNRKPGKHTLFGFNCLWIPRQKFLIAFMPRIKIKWEIFRGLHIDH